MKEQNPRLAEKVREHESTLRDIAESDLRCAKYAKQLLVIVDENRGGR